MNDVSMLLPSFRERVLAVFAALKQEGYNPRIFETYRTPARGAWLKLRGKTRNGAASLHCYNAAADFIDAKLGWENRKFFDALGKIGIAHGLTWGGDWDSDPSTPQDFDDRPHLQAIPVHMQKTFRALETLVARERFVAKHLKNYPMPRLPQM